MRDNEQPPVDPRLLAALVKADLDDLVTRLLGLARKKMRSRWKGLPPSGETPEDIVQKAFHQALSGIRKFPKGNVDLYVFLVMVMWSLISHLPEKEENRCVHTPIDQSADLLIDWKYTSREAELTAAADLARVLGDFAGEKLMMDYIRLLMEEQYRNAPDYARALGVDVTVIHNMNRRLARYRDRQRREKRPTDARPN
jgi:DNA-directed RNA polymerase specialized sigma24 family protein